MKKLEINIGQRFGRLTIIKEVEPNIQPSGVKRRKFLCKCDCGNEKVILISNLLSNSTLSCGCYWLEQTIKSTKRIKHNKYKTGAYKSWDAMIQRCTNPNHKGYSEYSKITICERWLNSFENFFEDMGERPEGYSIDRINPYGNYEPGNCRWATSKEQANNKRNKIKIL